MNNKTLFVLGLFVATAFWMMPFDQIKEELSFEDFRIKVDDSYKDGKQISQIILKTISHNDAKNMTMMIKGGEFELKSNSCPEGIIKSEKYGLGTKFTMDEMKFNSECILELISDPDDSIYKIIVTANDLKKYEWSVYSDSNALFEYAFMIVGLGGAIAIGFGYYTTSRKNYIELGFDHTLPTGMDLDEEFGKGFDEDDRQIVKAINKGKLNVDEISSYTTISKRSVRKRLKQMENKGMFYLE